MTQIKIGIYSIFSAIFGISYIITCMSKGSADTPLPLLYLCCLTLILAKLNEILLTLNDRRV
jgi:hypothetical protein